MTFDGEPVSKSLPVADFGNAITSRMLGASQSSAIMRSRPSATPPCGGQPWLEIRRKEGEKRAVRKRERERKKERKRKHERKKSSSHAPKSREKMVETTDDFR